MTARACEFCGAAASLRPFDRPPLYVCLSCAMRVADLAEDPASELWATEGPRIAADEPREGHAGGSEPEESDPEEVLEQLKAGIEAAAKSDDAAAHLALAEAYVEMGMYLDGRLTAAKAVVAKPVTPTTDLALGLLLSEPLLGESALPRLKKRLQRPLV